MSTTYHADSNVLSVALRLGLMWLEHLLGAFTSVLVERKSLHRNQHNREVLLT